MSSLDTYPYLDAGLWEESSEWVWLLAESYEHGRDAIQAAFEGSGPLPVGFRECGLDHQSQLTAHIIFARPGREDESGWAGRGEETWWRCAPDHPTAVRFWEVGPK
jgi:hypothetical protein